MAGGFGLFMRQLLLRPREVSALAPSSRWLARAMTEELGPRTGRVLEFGPGTGRLTEAILARGVAPGDLTLFEMNPEFVSHLRRRFPGVTVHHAGAQTAPAHVSPGAGAVISGLPLLSMPEALRREIVEAARNVLAPQGRMYQFTYGAHSPVPPETLASLGLGLGLGRYVWANLPPARVYIYTRT